MFLCFQETQRLLELRDKALNWVNECIWIADTSGSVLYINRGFTLVTGYEEKDVLGKKWDVIQVRISPPLSLHLGCIWSCFAMHARKASLLHFQHVRGSEV